jgi:hypothetical protein
MVTIIITFLLIIFMLGFVYFSITGNPIKKYESKKEVLDYLIQDKHYTANDILQIDDFYQMFVITSQNTCHYGAKAVFRNNPKVEKYYVVCPSNKVVLQSQN